jgi:hypothetical protein
MSKFWNEPPPVIAMTFGAFGSGRTVRMSSRPFGAERPLSDRGPAREMSLMMTARLPVSSAILCPRGNS